MISWGKSMAADNAAMAPKEGPWHPQSRFLGIRRQARLQTAQVWRPPSETELKLPVGGSATQPEPPYPQHATVPSVLTPQL